MTARYCRHDWTPCNEALRGAFTSHAGLEREFRVCRRCLRVEELEPHLASRPSQERESEGLGSIEEAADLAA